ncbi:MMPL family transporter [Proteinivorax hydrogeniformans]|uniref:MMPL family transporter n=1 Tax=Proteinivorax hydrogeniformans TaxID=1826727 RepID=A0AAU8HUT0_9FIRM
MKKDNIRLYGLLTIWIAVSVLLGYLAPDIDMLVRKHGQLEVPDGFPTQFAKELLEEDDGFTGEEILLLYKDTENGIAQHEDQIEKTLDKFKEDPGDIKVHDIITPFDGEQQRNLLVDESENILLAVVELDMTTAEISFIRDELQDKTSIKGLTSYITGAAIIEDDVLSTTEERLGAIEYLTVALVYIVLLAVFRSPIAPLVPLITLGSSYYLSISIVSLLIDNLNFPVSNFSQVFVLTVTFAIGTDYVILLMTRYREELANGSDDYSTVKRTFKLTQGAVLSSAFTGFVGFLAIGLANFNLYQSGVGVAVAVVTLILAIWVWVPIILNLFGSKVFWPAKLNKQQNEHKLWGKLGQFATNKPALGLLILLVIVLPLFLSFDNLRSFHSLDEIDDDYGSVKAFRIIEDKFGEGDFFYHILTIEANDPTWDDSQRVSYVELLSDNLLKIDDVTEVRSITRPEGLKIDELRISYQAGEAAGELDEVLDGIRDMKSGVSEMSSELRYAKDELRAGEDDLLRLIDGTNESKQGAQDLHQGIKETNQGVEQISWQVASAYQDAEGYYSLADSIHDQFLELTGQSSSIFTPILELFEEVVHEMAVLTYSLSEVSQGLDDLSSGSKELSDGLSEVHQGQKLLLEQYDELLKGLEEFLQGLDQLDEGLEELFTGMEEMQDFLFELEDQSENILDGFFIPKSIYTDQLQKAWDNYATPNNEVVLLQVVSDTNPYGMRAMEIVGEIEEITDFTLKGTPYEEARYAVDGLPSNNRDLKVLSSEDFFRTSIYMLIGIFIVLSVLFKSFMMPIYAMASLGVAYIASHALVEFIFIDGLGYPGVMWSVPFFTFVMLMSMGVDYSIFLMARFNEEIQNYKVRSRENIKTAMVTAMKKVGSAVFSAAVILASSFAAMMLSGVLSLLQIGAWIIIGLMFYILILLPIFIPAVAMFLGEYNWWPFNLINWDPKEKRFTLKNKSKSSDLTIYIEGEVYKPGEYTIKDDTPLSELIKKAGGLTPSADVSEIKISSEANQQLLNIPSVDSAKSKKAHNPNMLNGYNKHSTKKARKIRRKSRI